MSLGANKAALLGASAGGAPIKMYMMGGADNVGSNYTNSQCRIWDESADSWVLGTALTQGRAGNTNNQGGLWVCTGASYRNGVFNQAYGFAHGTLPVAIGYNYASKDDTTDNTGTGPGPNGAISMYWSMHDSMYISGFHAYTPNYWTRYNYVVSQAYTDDSYTARGASPQNVYYSGDTLCFSSETNIAHILGGKNATAGASTAWGTAINNTYDYSQSADSWTGQNAMPTVGAGNSTVWVDDTNEKGWCYGWQSDISAQTMNVWTYSSDSWATGASSTSPTQRARDEKCMAFNESSGIGYYSSGSAAAPESPTGRQNTGGAFNTKTDVWSVGVPADCGVGLVAGGMGFFGGLEQ